MPIWRCTAPRAMAAAPSGSSSRRWTRACGRGASWRWICATRCSTASSSSTTSRWSTSKATRSPGSRRWCAGITPGAAWSRRPSSFRWPRRPASSSRSANGCCTETASWPGNVKVAVNLSPAQLKSRNLTQLVVSALEESGLPANRLQLEITETVLMHNTFNTLATLHALRKLGVQIAMDDFGTGYSSLSYLRSFPFDKIKIDRSFIQDLSNGAEPLAIVHAVAGLARSLNMISTAEGVETQQQLDQLQAVGCTEMQGYLFSHARPTAEIVRMFLQPGAPAMASAS